MSIHETGTSGLMHRVAREALSWRHLLHQHPELAYQEHRTADFIATRLTEAGLHVTRNLGGTGVVGTLKRGTGGRTIGIRADMDALPVQELTGVAYASCMGGVMHACGHDGHVAMALAAAHICTRLPGLVGTVHFIFQPAEEGAAGARRMIEDGLFRTFPCEAIFALHNWPALPLGTCVALDGPMMAANAVIDVEITGRGCHAAMPHQGADPILAACELVSSLQSIVSRNTDPMASAVVSVTTIRGGEAHNVIPGACVLRGTARWFDKAVGDMLEQRVERLSAAIAEGFGCQARIAFERRYPATVNAPAMAAIVRTIVEKSALGLKVVNATPSMAAEDFAFMLQEVPGCYFWLGTGRSADEVSLHSPHYNFNDDVLVPGISLWVEIVRSFLAAT